MRSATPFVRRMGGLGAVPLLAIGLMVAGCSSGSNHKALASTSKSQFVARVDSICQSSNDQLGKDAQQTFDSEQPTLDAWRRFMVETALPIVDHRLAAMRAVAAPASDVAKVNAILAAGEAAVAQAKADPSLMSPGSRAPFERYDDLATGYGIGACAVGG